MHMVYGESGAHVKHCMTAISEGVATEGMQCAICLEFCKDSEVQDSWCQLLCGHCFHRACVVVWLRRAHCCPLCRRSSYTTDALSSAPLQWDPLELAVEEA